ncbi:MAG: acetyl-CoA carboxylase biotin carboxyl carrier protein subunit [Oscillospiraceae bacterium]|jgi:acetyl-CoA carboxylase biotin carboxyl carrier protein|nr:acetyl-CoA carboxylase biotin carboxyl carrier protein subunit [Oscillospiraceae bacterium]
MNLAAVKQLAELLEGSRLNSLTYKDSEFELSLSKSSSSSPALHIAAPAEEAPAAAASPATGKTVTVTAPVVGTVYGAREPGKPPLVAVGDEVREGDALCVIEAMKIFSEIPAPCNGKVVEIAFTDGGLAEFGAKLVVLELAE